MSARMPRCVGTIPVTAKNDMMALYCIVQDLTETRSNTSTPIKDKWKHSAQI